MNENKPRRWPKIGLLVSAASVCFALAFAVLAPTWTLQQEFRTISRHSMDQAEKQLVLSRAISQSSSYVTFGGVTAALSGVSAIAFLIAFMRQQREATRGPARSASSSTAREKSPREDE